MAGNVKIITINFNETGSIAPGEEVKVPVTVSPGKTGEIIGVNMQASGIAEATESTLPTTAQQISLQLEDVKGEHNVPIMYANTKGDSVKNGINGNHFHFEESQVGKVFGQGSVVGTKFQGSQLVARYKNYTDAPQTGIARVTIAYREY